MILLGIPVQLQLLVRQEVHDIMPPRRPPNFYKTVGRMTSSVGLAGPASQGHASGSSAPAVALPRIHVPGVGAVSLIDGSCADSEGPLLGPTDDAVWPGGNRSDAPAMKRVRKASVSDALAAAETLESRQVALDDLEFDKVANSARAARASTWATWCRMHLAWFGADIPVRWARPLV